MEDLSNPQGRRASSSALVENGHQLPEGKNARLFFPSMIDGHLPILPQMCPVLALVLPGHGMMPIQLLAPYSYFKVPARKEALTVSVPRGSDPRKGCFPSCQNDTCLVACCPVTGSHTFHSVNRKALMGLLGFCKTVFGQISDVACG